MRPSDTDPWTPVVTKDTAPSSSAPATILDESDGSVTRELARLPAAPSRRHGTDPGLGNLVGAPDTVIDAGESTIADTTVIDAAESDVQRPTAADTWVEGGPTDDELVAQLKNFSGRAQPFPYFQAESAGHFAASYDVVAKPAKSRAVARTDPYGVIVAPDSLPVAHVNPAVTAPMNVAAATGAAIPVRAQAPPEQIEQIVSRGSASERARRNAPTARFDDRITTTIPGGPKSKTRERRRRLLFASAVVGGLLGAALIVVFGFLREPAQSSSPQATALTAQPRAPHSTVPTPSATSTTWEPAAAASTQAAPMRPVMALAPPIANSGPSSATSGVRAPPPPFVPVATPRPLPQRAPTSAAGSTRDPSIPAAPSPAPTPTTRPDLLPNQ